MDHFLIALTKGHLGLRSTALDTLFGKVMLPVQE